MPWPVGPSYILALLEEVWSRFGWIVSEPGDRSHWDHSFPRSEYGRAELVYDIRRVE